MSIPVLAPAFLTKHPPSPELFAKYLGQGPWGPSCIPVYEWQGILFIACADPELISENTPENWRYVKSEFEVLSPLYADLAKSSEQFNPVTNLDSEPILLPEAAKNTELVELVESNPEPFQSNEVEVLEFTSEDERRSQSTKNSELTPNLIELQNNQEQLKVEKLEPVTEIEVPKNKKIDSAEQVAQPTAEIKNSMQPPNFAQDDEWLKIWNGLSGHFQNSMICLIQQNEVIPWKWDPTLISPDTEPQMLSLEIPSPFRIIARTGRPFHGAPSPNSVTDEFFKKWTRGQYPEHLTGVPLFKNQGLLGFLICWGSKSSANKDSLQVCEAFAKQASQLIKKQIEKTKTESTAA